MEDIVLDSMLRIPLSRLTSSQIAEIQYMLTLKLPTKGGYGQKGPTSIQAFDRTLLDIAVPRNWPNAREFISLNGAVDRRAAGSPVDLKFLGTLRPSQPEFIRYLADGLREDGLGVIGQAGCGYGKTIVSTALIAKMDVTTLFLVHKEKLMLQFIEACEKFLGYTPGVIQGDRCEYPDAKICVAMVQSLHARDYPPEMYNHFGMVIQDECLAGDTLVSTDVGQVPIKDIYSRGASTVISYDEDHDVWAHRRILKFIPKGTQPLVELKTERGALRCTADHLIRAERGWVKALELEPGEGILYPAPAEFPSRVTKSTPVVSVSELGIGEPVFDLEVEGNHNFVANGLLVHNCHHVSAPMFAGVVAQFPAKYRVGLTATPRRGDKMENIFFWHLGEIAAVGRGQFLDCAVYQVMWELNLKPSQWQFRGELNMGRLTTAISKDEIRTARIVGLIAKSIRAGRKALVLSDRCEHLENMCNRLRRMFKDAGEGYTCGIFATGKSKKKAQQRIDALLADATFGTWTMASEGLDCPEKDTIFFCTPKADVEQAAGRIRRLYTGKKEPLIVDFTDHQEGIGVLRGLARKREKFYDQTAVDKRAWPVKVISQIAS